MRKGEKSESDPPPHPKKRNSTATPLPLSYIPLYTPTSTLPSPNPPTPPPWEREARPRLPLLPPVAGAYTRKKKWERLLKCSVSDVSALRPGLASLLELTKLTTSPPPVLLYLPPTLPS